MSPLFVRHPQWSALVIHKCGCTTLKRAAMAAHGITGDPHGHYYRPAPAADLHIRATPAAGLPCYYIHRSPESRAASLYAHIHRPGSSLGKINYPYLIGATAEEFVICMEMVINNSNGDYELIESHMRPQSWSRRIAAAWQCQPLPLSQLHTLPGIGPLKENTTGSDPHTIFTPSQIKRIQALDY